ncbi:MAG: hypothetical protein K2Y23_09990 [Cyanobacteria bacterium]|nr:hypothetical protein [Cyanobacteriota bacterium]
MSLSPKKRRPLTEGADEHDQADPVTRTGDVVPDLMDFIGPDPVVADQKIEKLLKHLARSLEMHGCQDPDEVAAEALHRALKKLDKVTDISTSGFRAYVFGFAKNVLREGWKHVPRSQQLDETAWQAKSSSYDETAQIEARLMLREMQRLLTPEKWETLCRYSEEDNHEAHATELNMSVGHLRVRVHRIREELKEKALPECNRRPRKATGHMKRKAL